MTELISQINWMGIVIGVSTFLIIGLFHPIVIKGEYYFGTRCWWWFAVAGVALIVAALLVESVLASALLGVTGFSSFCSRYSSSRSACTRVGSRAIPNAPIHGTKKTKNDNILLSMKYLKA